MKVLLFSGKAECGKSTAATITKRLLEERGYKVLRMSYGDYVKQTAKMLYDWNGEKDEAGRKLLQWWGTDKVRAERPNFWCDTVKRLADIVKDDFDYLIIDDARYKNEMLCWNGYETCEIRIERPSHENALTPQQRAHISETSLDDWHFNIVISAWSIAELEWAVKLVLIPTVAPQADKPNRPTQAELENLFDSEKYVCGLTDVAKGEPVKGKYEGLSNDGLHNKICLGMSCEKCLLDFTHNDCGGGCWAFQDNNPEEFRKIAIEYLEGLEKQN